MFLPTSGFRRSRRRARRHHSGDTISEPVSHILKPRLAALVLDGIVKRTCDGQVFVAAVLQDCRRNRQQNPGSRGKKPTPEIRTPGSADRRHRTRRNPTAHTAQVTSFAALCAIAFGWEAREKLLDPVPEPPNAMKARRKELSNINSDGAACPRPCHDSFADA